MTGLFRWYNPRLPQDVREHPRDGGRGRRGGREGGRQPRPHARRVERGGDHLQGQEQGHPGPGQAVQEQSLFCALRTPKSCRKKISQKLLIVSLKNGLIVPLKTRESFWQKVLFFR